MQTVELYLALQKLDILQLVHLTKGGPLALDTSGNVDPVSFVTTMNF